MSGGLIALTVEECCALMRWYTDHAEAGYCDSEVCNPLVNRLAEWRSRHVEVAVDGD